MIRGVEGAVIFWDEKDREDFLSRMGKIGKTTRTRILAWALMGNHVHMLLFGDRDCDNCDLRSKFFSPKEPPFMSDLACCCKVEIFNNVPILDRNICLSRWH